MWINHVFLGFLGLAFGLSVASGSFAIAVKLGIIPEMASKSGSAGYFVGCMAVALAEIINAYPILYRRMKLKMGLEWMVATIAIGKMCGCLFYFFQGYDATA